MYFAVTLSSTSAKPAVRQNANVSFLRGSSTWLTCCCSWVCKKISLYEEELEVMECCQRSLLSVSSAKTFKERKVVSLGLELHPNLPTTLPSCFLSLPHLRVSVPSLLHCPAHPNKHDSILFSPSSDPLAVSSLLSTVASVRIPHLNEEICIESPLWSGATEPCHSSQKCCSRSASGKTPSLPTWATVRRRPCSSKRAANLHQEETKTVLQKQTRHVNIGKCHRISISPHTVTCKVSRQGARERCQDYAQYWAVWHFFSSGISVYSGHSEKEDASTFLLGYYFIPGFHCGMPLSPSCSFWGTEQAGDEAVGPTHAHCAPSLHAPSSHLYWAWAESPGRCDNSVSVLQMNLEQLPSPGEKAARWRVVYT